MRINGFRKCLSNGGVSVRMTTLSFCENGVLWHALPRSIACALASRLEQSLSGRRVRFHKVKPTSIHRESSDLNDIPCCLSFPIEALRNLSEIGLIVLSFAGLFTSPFRLFLFFSYYSEFSLWLHFVLFILSSAHAGSVPVTIRCSFSKHATDIARN